MLALITGEAWYSTTLCSIGMCTIHSLIHSFTHSPIHASICHQSKLKIRPLAILGPNCTVPTLSPHWGKKKEREMLMIPEQGSGRRRKQASMMAVMTLRCTILCSWQRLRAQRRGGAKWRARARAKMRGMRLEGHNDSLTKYRDHHQTNC